MLKILSASVNTLVARVIRRRGHVHPCPKAYLLMESAYKLLLSFGLMPGQVRSPLLQTSISQPFALASNRSFCQKQQSRSRQSKASPCTPRELASSWRFQGLRGYSPSKRRSLLTHLHGVTPQQTWIFSSSAVKTAHFTNVIFFHSSFMQEVLIFETWLSTQRTIRSFLVEKTFQGQYLHISLQTFW